MLNNTLVGRLFIVFAVLVLALPGVMAASTTVSGGATVTGTGSTGVFISNNAGTTAISATTLGGINAAYSVKDSTGKEVYVSLIVPYADKITYKFSTPNKNSATAAAATLTATQTFSVVNALSSNWNYNVQAQASAKNAEGDTAFTNMYSYQYNNQIGTTLTNVVQTVSAYASGTRASETIASASGGYDFWTDTGAGNARSFDAETYLSMWNNGQNVGSFKSLAMSANSAKAVVSASETLGSITTPVGGEMYLEGHGYSQSRGKDAWLETYNKPKSVTQTNLYANAQVDSAVVAAATGVYHPAPVYQIYWA